MERIVLTRELRERGFDPAEITRMLRCGELRTLRRGAYRVGSAALEESDVRTAHRALIEATWSQCSGRAVVSHMSAAVLHGLPTWDRELERVHLIRDREGGGRTRRHVVVRGLPIRPGEVVEVDGLPVTSVPRTVLDLACQLPLVQSVPIGDAAVRRAGTTFPYDDLLPVLQDQLRAASCRTGVPRARQAIGLLDPRSESVGESYSRVRFVQAGLPTPELQYEVWSAAGVLLGRCDFAWPELRTIGEFDGLVKYSGQFGQRTETVLVAEKKREDRIRDAGWEMVRWTWDELPEPSALIRKINAAFARGRRRAA